jgi:hypothetical protein
MRGNGTEAIPEIRECVAHFFKNCQFGSRGGGGLLSSARFEFRFEFAVEIIRALFFFVETLQLF